MISLWLEVKIIKRFSALFKTLITQPKVAMLVLQILRGTKKYTIAAIADFFSPFINKLEHEPKSVDELLNEQGFKDKDLFIELLRLLEAKKYVTLKDEKVFLNRKIPADILETTERKISKVVIEAFSPFANSFREILFNRLSGKAPSKFDENELRVLWSIALKGEFYAVQRRLSYKFTKIDEFLKQRPSPVRVLDYGCGSGSSTIQLYDFLKKHLSEFDVHACDISEGLLEIAKEDEALAYPIHFFNLKHQKPREAYYDAIFLGQVMHWFDKPVKMVGLLKSYLKPGGILFGVESIYHKSLYYIDLFIRILGSRGFPSEDEFFSWFEKNNMKVDYDYAVYAFKAYTVE